MQIRFAIYMILIELTPGVCIGGQQKHIIVSCNFLSILAYTAQNKYVEKIKRVKNYRLILLMSVWGKDKLQNVVSRRLK